MNIYIKCFLISLAIGLIFTIFYIVVKIILLYLNAKDAFNNIIYNTKYCGKERCPKVTPTPIQPNSIIDLNLWNINIAKYSAEIVYRIEDAAYNNTIKINYPEGLKVLKEIYNKNDYPIFGSIVESSEYIWLCFRGTQTNLDITQDLKIQQNDYFNNISSKQIELQLFEDNNKPLIHEGFMEIYMNLRKEILDTLQKHKSNKPIIVSGHSLGAAISTIAGFDLKQNNYKVVVYNYASPRIGDQALCNLINKNIKVFRIVNTTDIIPNLPLSVTPNFENPDKPYNYVHCGILKTFTDNWLSILNNHLIPVYMKGLENLNN